ncbi:MAG: efflux RND transporter periplasmic adaptor subunit [Pseudopedobacter saltans]|uniref:Efflux RND transporter periplasmic adaptor subunit n=1 Tax=Pseudopedobacter saltans TaxID=151895 RepID=A0A2W5HEE0_9SPHI|nr:MAG: efflux RND transporter periplasmic adaptor subunit [Pseudopedobacter saltans]
MKMNVLALVSVSLVLGLFSCKSKEKPAETTGKLLVTSTLGMDTSVVRNYVSQIHSIRHIEIRSQEKGYLEKVYVDEGQFVKKGQLLFQIMPAVYNAEKQKAAAEAEKARIELQNTQALFDKKVVAPNELAMSKASAAFAKAELNLANTHLKFTEIRAPFDGFIDKLDMKLGSLVDEGDLLTTLSDNAQMWVYFNVPEEEYLNYKLAEGQENLKEVHLLMANNEVFKQSGEVKTIEADFNNETGNIAFRATFPNPTNLLRDGETGTILMTIPMENSVVIPQKSSFEILDKKYVYVVDDNKQIHLTPIEVKAELPDLYIIQKGLTAGQKIILEGVRKVQDKDKIEFDYEEPNKVLKELKVASE